MRKTLNDLLDETGDRFPNHGALSFFGKTTTYRKFIDKVDQFSAFLKSRGLRHGDRVLLLLPNCPQMDIACWGIWKAGCVMVALNPLLKSEELMAMAQLVSPKMFITLKDVKEFDEHNQVIISCIGKDCQVVMTGMEDTLPLPLSIFYPLTTLLYRLKRKEKLPPHSSWRSIKLSPKERAKYNNGEIPGPDSFAVLQFTGGTTGSMKAAALTHANLVANVGQAMDLVGNVLNEDSVVFSAIPCFHVYGLSVCLVLAVSRGAKVVMIPRFMDKKKVIKNGKEVTVARINKEVLRVFKKERITLIPGIPNIFAAIIDDTRFRNFSIDSLRLCVSGSGALAPEVKERFEGWAGCEIIEGYGLSETSPIVSINPPGRAIPGSLGMPVRDTEIKIVPEPDAKPEDGGELWVRGPQVMWGYWENPQATAEVLTGDGWLKTGDMVRREGEYLVMTDRKKDMIKVSGENVYPSEIEKILLDKLGVAEVYVVGIPDDKTGERVVACVVLRDGEPPCDLVYIREACKELSKIKIPKQVRCFSKDEIPRTYLGKVQKKELRKLFSPGPA